MKKSSLNPNHQLNQLLTTPLATPLENYQWVFPLHKIQFLLQLSTFYILPASISCNHNDLIFVGKFLFPNGRPFLLQPVYRQQFLSRANKNATNIRFFILQDRNQLLLQCNIFFDSDVGPDQKMQRCLQCISSSQTDFQNALQLINLCQKNNPFKYKMLKRQLKFQKQINQLLNQNKSTQQIDQIHNTDLGNSAISQVACITESNQTDSPKTGGFFKVEKKKCQIQHSSGLMEQKFLACKTPNDPNMKNICEQKMQREIQLIKENLSDKYLLKYYLPSHRKQSIYMDYVPGTLNDAIYCNRLNLTQYISLCQQLVEAISILHLSKIVHRDLKPENILISGSSIKIIDFCQSVMTSDISSNQRLGWTFPYSPIECILGKSEGFNKKQIDLWSVAMILYEMTFKSLPIFQKRRLIGDDIFEKWREQKIEFSISSFNRKQRGLRVIQEAMSVISIRGLKLKPEERLSLKTYSLLLSQIKEYQNEMSTI